MEFVGHKGISASFDRLLGSSRLYCAVAFWGNGASKHLQLPQVGRDIRIICNLSMGGTNPAEIRKLQRGGAQVQQIDTLHAKVYIGDAEMLVTSANASTNGLGFEGAVQGNWIEAGVIGQIQDLALDWFLDLWSVSRPITEEDLSLATVKWRQRQASLLTPTPPLVARSFGEFDISPGQLPLVDWWEDTKWTPNLGALTEQVGKSKALAIDLENALDVAGPEDDAVLQPGTWVLRWRRAKNGRVGKSPLEWVQAGEQRLAKAYSYDDDDPKEFVDVVLPAENPGPEPFNAAEPSFRAAFARVLWRPEFAELRSSHYEGCWNTRERLALLPSFWRAVKTEYLSAT